MTGKEFTQAIQGNLNKANANGNLIAFRKIITNAFTLDKKEQTCGVNRVFHAYNYANVFAIVQNSPGFHQD